MTEFLDSDPWGRLPAAVADLIEPELAVISEDVLATIAVEVPEYARPLEGSFGRGIQRGVTEALRQFVALIRDPDSGRGPGRDVYVELGRGEFRQGRTLDSLQSAYRVGARVAWRRIAAAAREAKLEAAILGLLAEAIFAYIDELSADSVEGFSEARAEVEDLRRRRRRELAAMLIAGRPAEESDLAAAARAAVWALPRTVAALACPEDALAVFSRRLPTDSLVATLGDAGCALIPDPGGPGRIEQLERAATGLRVALGPAGPIAQLPTSWSLARAALRASEAGVLAAEGLVPVEDHLSILALFEASPLVTRIGERRLAALDSLTAKAQARMRETALAYVRHQGNAVAMADSMHVHPQTARYRVARLRELLGDQLDDPDARFELEMTLRLSRPACAAGS
ncbi:MAG TPA: helix-turn-helix domain-containing protein [Solirubrobacterales bacterium]